MARYAERPRSRSDRLHRSAFRIGPHVRCASDASLSQSALALEKAYPDLCSSRCTSAITLHVTPACTVRCTHSPTSQGTACRVHAGAVTSLSVELVGRRMTLVAPKDPVSCDDCLRFSCSLRFQALTVRAPFSLLVIPSAGQTPYLRFEHVCIRHCVEAERGQSTLPTSWLLQLLPSLEPVVSPACHNAQAGCPVHPWLRYAECIVWR